MKEKRHTVVFTVSEQGRVEPVLSVQWMPRRVVCLGRADDVMGMRCEDHIPHSFAFRLLSARSRASAQEAMCARGLSARLVRTIGTRAPRTMPAVCAPARYSN